MNDINAFHSLALPPVIVVVWLQYWLKLSPPGTSPVSPLTSAHRHPWEPILVLAPATAAAAVARPTHACSPSAPHAVDLQPTECDCSDSQGIAAGTEVPQGAGACSSPVSQPAAVGFQQDCGWRCLPDGLVIAGVPAAEHSRKPHLGRLLEVLLGQARAGSEQGCGGHRGVGRGLELFGRELRAGWDVVGDEVLKFQGLAGFEAR